MKDEYYGKGKEEYGYGKEKYGKEEYGKGYGYGKTIF
jgi:hypothetical protein